MTTKRHYLVLEGYNTLKFLQMEILGASALVLHFHIICIGSQFW